MWRGLFLGLLWLSTAAPLRDFYEVLGVPRDASAAEVKKAHKQLALRYHPDKNRAADAEKVFIEIQKAYEVLGDPDRRRKYDARSRFFNGEERDDEGREGAEGTPGAPDFGRGSVIDDGDALKAAAMSEELWLFHVYVDRSALFGDWMTELPDEFSLGHVNLERSEELAEAMREMHNGHMGRVPFLVVCQQGRCRSFVPSMGGFFAFFRSVNSDVISEALQLVDYWRQMAGPRSDHELRQFSEFRAGTSARLRVIFLVEDEGERHFGAYAASSRLGRVAHFAQMRYFDAVDSRGEPGSFLGHFGVTRLPSIVIFDPVSGASATASGQRSLSSAAGTVERILRGERVSARLSPLQELDEHTYAWRCASGTACDYVAVLGTPASFEKGKELAEALGTFAKACESLAAVQEHLAHSVACFWLRLGRAPVWEQLLRSSSSEAPMLALLARDSAAVAPPDVAASSRATFRWIRDTMRRGNVELSPFEWPRLPQALGLDDEAHGMSWAGAWRRASTKLRSSLQAVLAFIDGADAGSFYGALLLMIAGLLVLWYFLGESGPEETTLEQALATLEFQITVVLLRKDGADLGFGMAGHKHGGLEITSISQGGLLEAWNERALRPEQRVRPGDRLVRVSWAEQDQNRSCFANDGPIRMAKALKQVQSAEVALTVLPGSERDLERLESIVTLDGLALKDLGNFVNGAWPDGSMRYDLEFVGIKQPLADWNSARLAAGACATQQLEMGDRVVSVGRHVDTVGHMGDTSPTVLLVKWRGRDSLQRRRLTIELEREDPSQPWGLSLCTHVAAGEPGIYVKRVQAPSPAAKHDEGADPVLAGDHLVSVNGHEGVKEISQELRQLRVVLCFERWLPKGSAGEASAAAPGLVSHSQAAPKAQDDGWDADLDDEN